MSSEAASQRAAISVASASLRSAIFRRLGTFSGPFTSGVSVASGSSARRRAWFSATSAAGVASIWTGDGAKTGGTPVSRATSRMRATKKRSTTTATTRVVACGDPEGASVEPVLVTLLADAEPVALPLRDVTERAHVTDPVHVDDAVEVVRLVLDHAGEEVLGDELDGVALPVETLEAHRRVARHHAPHIGHREAALPAVLRLLRERRDRGVDHDGERDLRRLGAARVHGHLDHRDLPRHVHPVGGQPGTVVLVHGLDPVLQQPP